MPDASAVIVRGRSEHPGAQALGVIREAELRAAAAALGVGDVTLLDYRDGALDRAEPTRSHRKDCDAHSSRPSRCGRDLWSRWRIWPSGSRRHLSIDDGGHRGRGRRSVRARRCRGDRAATHVSKLYYIAWPASVWATYQAAVQRLVSVVDGVERQATPWPDWAITTTIDTRSVAEQGLACGVVSRIADRGVCDALEPAAGTAARALGMAVLLSRVQSRERRARARNRSLRGLLDR